MKAFEEWENTAVDNCTTPNEVCDIVENCSACTQLKKEGWRAALEEVLKQVETSNSDGSIIDWIKKELE